MDAATKIKFPILEEWVCLCMLADADVVESDVYGVRVNALIDGRIPQFMYVCMYVYVFLIVKQILFSL